MAILGAAAIDVLEQTGRKQIGQKEIGAAKIQQSGKKERIRENRTAANTRQNQA